MFLRLLDLVTDQYIRPHRDLLGGCSKVKQCTSAWLLFTFGLLA